MEVGFCSGGICTLLFRDYTDLCVPHLHPLVASLWLIFPFRCKLAPRTNASVMGKYTSEQKLQLLNNLDLESKHRTYDSTSP